MTGGKFVTAATARLGRRIAEPFAALQHRQLYLRKLRLVRGIAGQLGGALAARRRFRVAAGSTHERNVARCVPHRRLLRAAPLVAFVRHGNWCLMTWQIASTVRFGCGKPGHVTRSVERIRGCAKSTATYDSAAKTR